MNEEELDAAISAERSYANFLKKRNLLDGGDEALETAKRLEQEKQERFGT